MPSLRKGSSPSSLFLIHDQRVSASGRQAFAPWRRFAKFTKSSAVMLPPSNIGQPQGVPRNPLRKTPSMQIPGGVIDGREDL